MRQYTSVQKDKVFKICKTAFKNAVGSDKQETALVSLFEDVWSSVMTGIGGGNNFTEEELDAAVIAGAVHDFVSERTSTKASIAEENLLYPVQRALEAQ